MTTLWQDLRYGLRLLAKSPAVSAVAVVALAIGIGANTAVFSISKAVLLESLPVEEPSRLVVVGERDERGLSISTLPATELFSVPSFRRIRDDLAEFRGIAAVGSAPVTAYARVPGTGLSRDDPVDVALVSGNYFAVLGVRPKLGRLLRIEDERMGGEPPAVVLSHGYWQRQFGGDPAVVGRSLVVNEFDLRIAGVASDEFFGDRLGERPDLWAPLTLQPQVMRQSSYVEHADYYWLRLIGRLENGVSLRRAEGAFDVYWQGLMRSQAGEALDTETDRWLARSHITLLPGDKGVSALRQRYTGPLLMLSVVAGFVLLIACANVAILLLSRATARRNEIGTRLALGASRCRVVRQLITESVMLGAAGCIAGLLLAVWSRQTLLGMLTTGPGAPLIEAEIDATVLGFSIAATGITVLLFGLVPALRATRIDPSPALHKYEHGRRGTHGRLNFGQTLVVMQVAMSLVLLVGAGLFLRSLRILRAADVGYQTGNVLMVRIDPRGAGFEQSRLPGVYERIAERVSDLPGVNAVSFAQYSLLGGGSGSSTVRVEGYDYKPGEDADANQNVVTEDYFETLGIRIIEGRGFTWEDHRNGPAVTVISSNMARRYFPVRSAVGAHIVVDEETGSRVRIVGVAEAIRENGPRAEPREVMYLPYRGGSRFLPVMHVSVAGRPQNAASAIRAAVGAAAPGVPVRSVEQLGTRLERVINQDRMLARLTAVFGILALLLAVTGLFGLMSFAIGRQTKEIGIRIALGAERARVFRATLAESIRLVAAGLLVGVLTSIGLSQFVRSALYEVSPRDPLTIVVAAILVAVCAAAAAAVPAMRAARVDPMTALRYE